MTSRKKKILLCALGACVIFLASCAYDWAWKPDPYSGDHKTSSIYGVDGDAIECSNPEFDNFTCFHYDNIEELKIEIEKMKEFCNK